MKIYYLFAVYFETQPTCTSYCCCCLHRCCGALGEVQVNILITLVGFFGGEGAAFDVLMLGAGL